MGRSTLLNILDQIAESDLGFARRRGMMAITNTLLGVVEMSYKRSEKTYLVINQDPDRPGSIIRTELGHEEMKKYLIENIYGSFFTEQEASA